MQLLCLAEDIRTDQWDVSALLRHNGCDMRQSLLQLQFWARSGGGHSTDRPVTDTAKKGKGCFKLFPGFSHLNLRFPLQFRVKKLQSPIINAF